MSKLKLLFLIINLFFFFDGEAQNLVLSISGKSEKETRIIDSLNYRKQHINYTSITNEVNSLKKNLNYLGYLQNKLIEIKKENDSLVIAKFYLLEKVSSIIINYNKNDIPKELLEIYSKNVSDSFFILPIENLEKTLYDLNYKIANQGLPFSTLKLSEIKTNSKNIIEANLVSSKKTELRKLDDIVIKGYKKFPKSYLKHFLKLKKNSKFNISDIKEKTNTLNNIRFANKIKDPEVLFTKDSTVLYLYIEKKKSNAFDGFLGFGNNEDNSKLTFNGYLNLDLNNNLNFGESFKLLYKSDENEQKTFNATVNTPYLFNSPLGTELELNIFKQDSSFTTVNQSAKLYYQLNYKNSVAIGIKSIKSTNLLENSNTQNIEDYSSNFYTLNLNHINRNNFNSIYQVQSEVNLQLGIGSRTDETDKTEQKTIKLESSKLFNLNTKNSIFLRANGFKLFSNNYLENELERFGGINSLRGFDENSILATTYGILNTEYRYLLSKSIYIHSIIDLAYLENDLNNQKEKLYGYGIGLGLLTKAGLLKFNYANGKNENQKFKLANSKIHISLTTVF